MTKKQQRNGRRWEPKNRGVAETYPASGHRIVNVVPTV